LAYGGSNSPDAMSESRSTQNELSDDVLDKRPSISNSPCLAARRHFTFPHFTRSVQRILINKSERDAAAQPGPTPTAVRLPNSDQSVNDQQKQSSILVGIDWADKTHSFHLIDPAGVTASGNLDQSPEAIETGFSVDSQSILMHV